MRHNEVHNFIRKFFGLHEAGRKARLNLNCHGGQLWVSLHAELSEQPSQAVPLLPKQGAVPATHQTQPPCCCRKGGRPCREARRARRVLATFTSLTFYDCEASEPPVDLVPAHTLHSAETVETDFAEVVALATPPQHVSHEEEATARRQACRERDARQSLAMSEEEHEAETMRDFDSPDRDVYSPGSEDFSPRDVTLCSDEGGTKERKKGTLSKQEVETMISYLSRTVFKDFPQANS